MDQEIKERSRKANSCGCTFVVLAVAISPILLIALHGLKSGNIYAQRKRCYNNLRQLTSSLEAFSGPAASESAVLPVLDQEKLVRSKALAKSCFCHFDGTYSVVPSSGSEAWSIACSFHGTTGNTVPGQTDPGWLMTLSRLVPRGP